MFAGTQMATAFIGLALVMTTKVKQFKVNLRETFLLTSLCWVFMSAFGALPFCFSTADLSYTRAFFEAMASITTTGSTTMTGLDNLPHGILLWRFMLLWIGGIGFLMIALAIFPLLQISGMQLFKSQSFHIEKVMPKGHHIAAYICFTYTALTVLCAVFLKQAGMSSFDAICHAMAAISTGGISTHDAGLAWFNSAAIDTVLVTFMIAGSLPFVHYLRIVKGDFSVLWRDSQVRVFFSILLTLTLCTALWIHHRTDMGLPEALHEALFFTTSYITTTGFINEDHSTWGSFAVGVAFMAIFCGACSGSTAGGVKIFRLQILFLMLRQQACKLISPNGIFPVRYNNKAVEPGLQASVAGFFFIYITAWMMLGILLQWTGLDFETAFSGSIAAISNTGVGSGDMIGPSGNFAGLPDTAIWIMSFGMLFGRVEFLALMVLLTPKFWRG
jgi:trk system potassium uptake protein TrkH